MIFKRCVICLSALLLFIGLAHYDPIQAGNYIPGIVLIFDDFGYHPVGNNVMQGFLNLPIPFAVSIIPGLRYSTEIAQAFHDAGKEVMIHMPMEAAGNHDHEDFELTTDMTRDEIRTLFIRANADIPFAKGLSNHQGSLFTADSSAMRKLIEIMAETNLYFVDSYTVYSTTAYKTARKYGLPALKRHIFIDSDLEEGETELSRLADVVKIAHEYRNAVGIGHKYRKTLEAVEIFIQSPEGQEVEFIFPSQVFENK